MDHECLRELDLTNLVHNFQSCPPCGRTNVFPWSWDLFEPEPSRTLQIWAELGCVGQVRIDRDDLNPMVYGSAHASASQVDFD